MALATSTDEARDAFLEYSNSLNLPKGWGTPKPMESKNDDSAPKDKTANGVKS